MFQIKKELVPLKLLMFTFYGALGCLMPFMTLQMYHLGVSHEAVTMLNSVLSITSVMGPPLVGAMADKFGNHRLIAIIIMLLAGVFHTSLLYIPSLERTVVPPELKVICNSYGSAIVASSCAENCPVYSSSTYTSFRISNCEYVCGEKRFDFLPTNFQKEQSSNETASTFSTKPSFCLQVNSTSVAECITLKSGSDFFNISRTLEIGYSKSIDGTEYCVYPQLHFTFDNEEYSQLVCNVPSEQCQVSCSVFEVKSEHIEVEESTCASEFETSPDKYPVKATNLSEKLSCMHVKGNEVLTFWVLLIVRTLSDLCPACLLVIFDAVILKMVAMYHGDFGREKMFGLFSVGIFAPIVGLLLDGNDYISFAPVFYVFDVLMIVTAVLTFTLPFTAESDRPNMIENLKKLCHTYQIFVILIIMVTLGSFYGFLETFTYVYLLKLCAPNYLLGLTVTIGMTVSLPFMLFSETIVKYCGHHYLLMLAFLGYSIRCIGFSYIENPWWSMPLEALDVVTINLMYVAAVTLTYKLAPKSLVATAQGLIWISHFNIGRCVGTFVGGYLIQVYGIVYIFEVLGVFSFCVTVMYLLVHYIHERQTARKRRPEPVQERKQNDFLPNGNYIPLSITENNIVENCI